MRPAGAVAGLIAVAFAGACSSASDPSEATPDLRGRYGAGDLWRVSRTYTYQSANVQSGGCGGTLEIAEQTGAEFGGSFAQDPPCGHSGRVEGSIHGVDLTLRLLPDDWAAERTHPPPGWDANCRLDSQTQPYKGLFTIDGGLVAQRRLEWQCDGFRVITVAGVWAPRLAQ